MKLQYFISVLLITYSCIQPNNGLYNIDPRAFNERKITLSDIAKDITYIPLDNSIPFTNFKYILTSDYYYISAKGIGILKFDRNGRLIQKIGRQGRGPGEFFYGMDFAIDEQSGNVYVLDPKKIKVYSPYGRFLKEILYDRYITGHAMAGGIEVYNSLLFLPDFLMEGDSKFNWIILDTLGNLVSSKHNSVPPFHTKYGRPGCVYRFDDKLFYYNYFNDSIFSINPDLSNNCVYLFAQGDHRWSRSKIEADSFEQFTSQVSKLFLPIRMFETKKHIVLRYYYLKKAATAFIEKKTKETFLAIRNNGLQNEDEFSNFSLTNDLDGGLPLTDMDYCVENDNEYITTLINPLNLKRHIEKDEFKKVIPKYPEKKEDLIKLAKSLKETDNPVLMMVRLKK